MTYVYSVVWNQSSEDESNLCTIILPWVKFCYKHLPMNVRNSTDIFQ